jgi:hypothetical protein
MSASFITNCFMVHKQALANGLIAAALQNQFGLYGKNHHLNSVRKLLAFALLVKLDDGIAMKLLDGLDSLCIRGEINAMTPQTHMFKNKKNLIPGHCETILYTSSLNDFVFGFLDSSSGGRSYDQRSKDDLFNHYGIFLASCVCRYSLSGRSSIAVVMALLAVAVIYRFCVACRGSVALLLIVGAAFLRGTFAAHDQLHGHEMEEDKADFNAVRFMQSWPPSLLEVADFMHRLMSWEWQVIIRNGLRRKDEIDDLLKDEASLMGIAWKKITTPRADETAALSAVVAEKQAPTESVQAPEPVEPTSTLIGRVLKLKRSDSGDKKKSVECLVWIH